MASPLEQFVNNVRTYSAQGNFHDLCDFLNNSTEVLIQYNQLLDTVLETLDLQQHSLGILNVLCVKLSKPPQASNGGASPPSQNPEADYNEIIFAQVQEFIIGCNGEQVRFAPDSFAELCHLFTKMLTEMKCPMRGIDLLSRAIKKIQINDTQLTSIHSDLCQLCILAKCFKPALEFLNVDICSICKEGNQFDSKYFLSYYYYGGVIYAALKNFEKSLYFFDVCITVPAFAVSQIMLEAYKKRTLVSFILHGKFIPLPKYTSHIVGRFIKPLSLPYVGLAAVYLQNDPVEIKYVVEKYQETYIRENNMGLVKQLVSSVFKKNILKLTKTFMTLSLTDVASRVHLSGPVEAEEYLLNMIEDGEIFATINQKDGMVIFHDDPERYNNPNMLQRLENEMSLCVELDKKIQSMEEEILVNPQFVKKLIFEKEDEPPTPGCKVPSYSMMCDDDL